MLNPMEVIALIAGRTDRLYLWTHYYDAERVKANRNVAPTMGAPHRAEYGGFSHDLYPHSYQGTLDLNLFLGGPAAGSHWLTRADLLNGLRHFGFNDLRIGHDTPDHPGGPAISIAARRLPA